MYNCHHWHQWHPWHPWYITYHAPIIIVLYHLRTYMYKCIIITQSCHLHKRNLRWWLTNYKISENYSINCLAHAIGQLQTACHFLLLSFMSELFCLKLKWDTITLRPPPIHFTRNSTHNIPYIQQRVRNGMNECKHLSNWEICEGFSCFSTFFFFLIKLI